MKAVIERDGHDRGAGLCLIAPSRRCSDAKRVPVVRREARVPAVRIAEHAVRSRWQPISNLHRQTLGPDSPKPYP